MSSEPVRQPANDLVAFDISKQSPEQIAQLFARWKQQRKRLTALATQRAARPPHLRPVPPVVRGAAQEAPETVEETEEATAPTEGGGPIRYSASFEALLTPREPGLARRVWEPDAGLVKAARSHPSRRRSRMKWVLAGAASVVAVAAVAGGALWEQVRPAGMQAGASPAEAALPATSTYSTDIPMMEPFVTTAIAAREADWPMRRAIDLALMKPAPVAETAHLPLMPQLKPPVPVVQTASKPSPAKQAPKPAAEANEAAITRVELPLAPNATTTTVSIPAAPAADARADDPRPDGAVSRGNDKSFGVNNRMASSDSKPAGGARSGGGASPGSGSSGGAGTGGSGDPSGGNTGGDGSGAGGDSGGETGGGTGGGDTGGGDPGGGDSGGGGPGGGDSGGGDSGGGDAGGGDAGGGDAGGGDAGGDSGGGDSGGDGSEGGDSGSGESGESGDGGSASGGGVGGAIGGAVGGIGDAVGGALGGGKDNAEGNKDKDKNKAD